jgi:myosin heavy subunit
MSAASNQQTTQWVQGFFDWLNAYNQHRSEDIQSHYAKQVQYSINGVLAAKNVDALQARFKKMLEKMQSFHVVRPLQAVVVNQRDAIVVYKLKVKLHHESAYTDLIATHIHFSKIGKVTSWNAVIEHKV